MDEIRLGGGWVDLISHFASAKYFAKGVAFDFTVRVSERFHFILPPKGCDRMAKIRGSWSGMRKYLEQEMLAESLKGRVRYGCTSYVGMDGCHIFEVCIDGTQVKRFSLETVNTYFIDSGYADDTDRSGIVGYWDGFWRVLDSHPLSERTEYTDVEFCEALEAYRNRDIRDSIGSDNPLIRMFAILDRRVGQRTLAQLKETVDAQPAWLQPFYRLRLDAEHIERRRLRGE